MFSKNTDWAPVAPTEPISSLSTKIQQAVYVDASTSKIAFNEVYAKYFTEKPARSCVAVKTLPKNVLCEVEVIAYLGK